MHLRAEASETSRRWLQLFFRSRYLPFPDREIATHQTLNYSDLKIPELSNTSNCFSVMSVPSCPADLALLRGVSEVFKKFVTLYLLPSWQSPLSVKGFGVSARIVSSVLSLHFFHPRHAPVPCRNRLQLAVRVAVCTK